MDEVIEVEESNEEEFDFSGFVDPQEEISSQPDSSPQGVPGFYRNVLTDDIPEPIRNMLLPKLNEIDSGVNKKFQDIHNQYIPYKAYQSFVDNGMSAEDIQSYIQLGNLIQNNPAEFYELLGQDLLAQGILSQDEGDVYEEEAGVPSHLEVELNNQREMIQQFMQEQQAQQQEAKDAEIANQMFSQLSNELHSLEQKVNKGQALPPQIKREIFGRIQSMEQATGQPVTMEQAWVDLVKTSTMIAQTRKTPRPINGSSSAIPGATPQTRTPEEREAAVQEVINRYKNQ